MDPEAVNMRQRTDRATGPSKNIPQNSEPQLPPSRQVPEVHHYANSNEYAQAVRAWLWAYHNWHFNQCLFGGPAVSNLRHTEVIVAGQQHVPAAPLLGADNAPAQTAPTNMGGRTFVTPSLGRRLIAEMIDFLFCFIIKLMVSYVLVELDFINMDKYEKLLNGESDLKTFIDVTQELFPLGIVDKLVTSIVEAIYISYGIGMSPAGSTPGKFLMNLKVVTCVNVVPVPGSDYRVTVFPGTPVPLKQSVIRSFIKNFALWFMFPVCFAMYVFRFGRSLYDLQSNTIVVEF